MCRVRVHIDHDACFCDVGFTYPGCAQAAKGAGVHRLKGLASWVQNVVTSDSSSFTIAAEATKTVRLLTSRSVCCLRIGEHKYERNVFPVPLVYQLSDKASLGSYAPRDKV